MDLTKLIVTNRLAWDELLPDRLHSLFALFLGGIEITQAVQYFDSDEHLTDPADHAVDNAVRLVAGKPAWVRVYVNSLLGASGITATLEVARRRQGLLWEPVATLTPDPSSATSVPALAASGYAEQRGNAGRSVNFVIPAAEMIGTLRLVAHVSAGTRSVEGSVVVPVQLKQTLRLAGVLISYDGPASMAPDATDLTIAAPTLADLQAMSGTALNLFPVESGADFRSAGTLTLTTHLQQSVFPTTGCGPGWDALHAQVVTARTADGNQPGWIYYGLLPDGVPMGPVGGCGGGGVAVGPVEEPGTLAHEAGHACGLKHAPAGGAPNPDPGYPVYEPYASASTGEFGLNVSTGAIATPQTFRDFMAYGGPSWIGLYHYDLLLENDRLNPVTVGIDDWWWKDLVWEELRKWPFIPELLPPLDGPPFELELPMFPPSRLEDVVSLIVRVEHGKVAEVLSVARVQAHTALPRASETTLTANLRDASGAVLASGTLFRLETSACGCGGSGVHHAGRHGHRDGWGTAAPATYLAQAFVPDVGPGASIDITHRDEVLWQRQAPAKPPRLKGGSTKVDEKTGEVAVRWDVSGPVVEYWLRWSSDGKAWRSVATGLTRRTTSIAGGQLPPGDGLLQVVAHDGFFSTYSEPFAVSVPPRAPSIAILHPVDRFTYVAGQTVRLWASVIESEARRVEAVWSVDGKEVGRGLDTWVTLEPGELVVSVRLADAEARVTVNVERRQE